MNNSYDVIIIGSGLSGSILATILAKNQQRVLMVDKGAHPQFTIGESTIPYFTQMLASISESFDIPEIAPRALRQQLIHSIGLKYHFGYVYHREGRRAEPAEVNMLNLGLPEFHLFRQDVDSYLFANAVQYGAEFKQNCGIKSVRHDGDGVTLETDRGELLRARYVVDGSGFRSVLAGQFGLRESTPRFRTNSRSIFTHMIGVTPFDQVMPRSRHRMPEDLYKGTLHHIFDGGWMWVIPFNNHKASRNPAVSVGLQFDGRFPRTDCPPEEEFRATIQRFPDVADQFKDAKAIRAWVASDRLQYSSTAMTGPRYCLLPHAYAFIDPLYSRGMAITLEGIMELAPVLLDALATGDFSAERFQNYETTAVNGTEIHDLLAWGAYVAFRDYDLWKSWFGFWACSEMPFFDLLKTRVRWRRGNRESLRLLDKSGNLAAWKTLVSDVEKLMLAVVSGGMTAKDAALAINEKVQAFDYFPGYIRRGLLYKGAASLNPLKLLQFGMFERKSPDAERYWKAFPILQALRLVRATAKA